MCCMQLQSKSVADLIRAPTQKSSEALFMRNYDTASTADLRVEFKTPEGSTVFEETYRVGSQATEIVDLPVSPGSYEVTVRLNSTTSDSDTCRIGDDPTELAYVETGNGVVSVVSGI